MTFTRQLAKLVSIPIRKWRTFWLLDISPEKEQELLSHFRTKEEQSIWLENIKEHNRQIKKQYFQSYAKQHILPNIHTTNSNSHTNNSGNKSPKIIPTFFDKLGISSYIRYTPLFSSSTGTNYHQGFSNFNKHLIFFIISSIPVIASAIYIYYFNLQYPREKRQPSLLGYSLPFLPQFQANTNNTTSKNSSSIITSVEPVTPGLPIPSSSSPSQPQSETRSTLSDQEFSSNQNEKLQELQKNIQKLQEEVVLLQQQHEKKESNNNNSISNTLSSTDTISSITIPKS